MDYYSKYLKYKRKYLNLKGGGKNNQINSLQTDRESAIQEAENNGEYVEPENIIKNIINNKIIYEKGSVDKKEGEGEGEKKQLPKEENDLYD